MDLAYKLVLINIDTILRVWKPCKDSKSETMTTSQKHKDFVKDKFACIVAEENDVGNGNEVEDEDKE